MCFEFALSGIQKKKKKTLYKHCVISAFHSTYDRLLSLIVSFDSRPWRCGLWPVLHLIIYLLGLWNLCQALDAAFLPFSIRIVSRYSGNCWIINHVLLTVMSNLSFWNVESDGGRRAEGGRSSAPLRPCLSFQIKM